MRVLWLADVLTAAGLDVVQHDGWRTRGFEPWSPRYGIVHATAAPRTQPDSTQIAIVRDGHKGLAGPIANAVVDRSGRWHVVASGRCNTAKTGWAGPAAGLGNTHLLGVEACNDNVSEPWPAAQYEAYVVGWAAICGRMDWDAGKCVGHREHQPGDKSDPTFSMDAFRHRVAAVMGDDVSAQEVWEYGIRNPESGTRMSAGARLIDVESDTGVLVRAVPDLAAKLDALTKLVAGEDVAAVVREQLDAHRATLLAELGEDLADDLAERLSEVPAEQVRAAVVDALRERDRRAAGDAG